MIIENGVLYDVHNIDLNPEGSFITPDGVTSIGDWAFYNCTGLTYVTIPDSVTNIGVEAFSGCHSLKSITIPNSITRIGGGAFSYCPGLTSVIVGKGITSIGKYVFYNCTGLASKKANYKAFSITKTGKLECLSKIYTVGKKSMVRGKLILCHNGIHYCTNIFDIFSYYHGEYGKDFVIGLCEVSEKNIGDKIGSKRCARWVKPAKILSREEVIRIMNGEE